ncbi:TIGR02450 family Trp-rich protein [Salinisphaera orenii]|uniref:TIGR02450 family Trp-rich protein n=1 Tax=Salinisphaera orenii YIM 95161 TaxID=1051139 RepID=A0A423PNE8_9GAMM|nr:TIGR02450 family Trp-rich protein [Salinisphaera halophila]ROO27110.1 hypothetical protein SAHL_11795 [Salinisphaera halophila YIM 95161]
MNTINPNKLHHSKWTAVRPARNEKHFIVTELLHDKSDHVVEVVLEAVMSGRTFRLGWRELKDRAVWQMGWK